MILPCGEDMRSAVTRPAFLIALLVLVSCSCSCGFCRPRPSVTFVLPGSVDAGGSQFLLTVNGNDFRFDSFVTWNGAFRPTTFISTHQMVAVISASDVAVPGTEQVRVFTPGDTDVTAVSAPGIIFVAAGCGGGNSNVIMVTVTAESS